MRNFYTDPQGNTFEWESPDPPQVPLDATGALATLLAVTGTLTVADAANAAGVEPEHLIAEAKAWAVAQETQ
jgi:hypothetical protein